MYFAKWPFGVVPEDSIAVWADRAHLKENLEELFRDVAEHKRSTIVGMWGYVGAGKSHTLLYFKNILEKRGEIFVIYSPMPKELKTFGDLYKQAFIGRLDFTKFAKITSDFYKTHPMHEFDFLEFVSSKITEHSPDMTQALTKLGKAVATGGPMNPLVPLIGSWLRGQRLPRSELRQLGLSSNIKYDSDWIKAAAAIIKMITFADDKTRGHKMIVWMLDDCHYLAELMGKKSRAAIQQSLRELFDSAREGFCMILSFASGQASVLEDLLVPDLLSRVGEKVDVPPLNKEECKVFIKDLFKNSLFRSPDAGRGEYYPFTSDSVRFLIDSITEFEALTPRNLMKCLELLVRRAEKDIYPDLIDRNFIKRNLHDVKEILGIPE